MKLNSTLSIAIPTFNRGATLDISLKYHVPLLAEYGIPIIIRDNNSTDDTEEVVKRWMDIYPYIFYYKNNANLGPDKNFELVLKDSKTDYVWLLGDTYSIKKEHIEFILRQSSCGSDYDFFVFNVINRVAGADSKLYSDANEVFVDIGWHMTCMAALVFNTKNLTLMNFDRYKKTNFIQLGIILEFISINKFLLSWNSNLSVGTFREFTKEPSSWEKNTFDVWILGWIGFIFSLPFKYGFESKVKVIKDHGHKSGLFGFVGFLNLRAKNILTIKSFFEYLNYFKMVTYIPGLILFLLTITPSWCIRLIKKIKNIKTI